MKRIVCLGVLFACLATSTPAAPTSPVRLGPGAAPDDPPAIPEETAETSPTNPATRTLPVTRITNVTVPTITIFRPDPEHAKGAAVVVCPGGAYHHLAIDKEDTEICE